MTPPRRRLAPLGFLFATVAFALAAAIPAAKGESVNATFLALAVVFAILAAATWRKSR